MDKDAALERVQVLLSHTGGETKSGDALEIVVNVRGQTLSVPVLLLLQKPQILNLLSNGLNKRN